MANVIDIESTIITLERTMCYGSCPVYTLTIYGNGTVVYDGREYVKVSGRHTAEIPRDRVKELIAEFYRANYFSLRDSYEGFYVTDQASVITSITIAGKTKRISHYLGDFDAPRELTRLEDKIDEIVDSRRWVDGE